MRKIVFTSTLVVVSTLVASTASAGDCGEMRTDGTMTGVCVDGKLFRGHIGATYAKLHGLDASPSRDGVGFAARVDGAIITGFIGAPRFGQSGFLFHDSFYLDLVLGYMTSAPFDPGPALGSERKEDRKLVLSSFGYLALAGWAFPNASIAGGLDFGWTTQFFGQTSTTTLLNGTRSIMLRAMFAGFVATAWKGALLGGNDRIGGELDIPISERPLWIAVRFDALPGQNYELPLGAPVGTSDGSTWAATIGLRVCGSWSICR